MSRRVIVPLDGRFHDASPLRSQGQPSLIGYFTGLELFDGDAGDLHVCPELVPVESGGSDRPGSTDGL
jgi:hypothetical protein